MELINSYVSKGIKLSPKNGYSKIATLHVGVGATPGIPSYMTCGFNLDVSMYGNLYYVGKPLNARFFVYVKGNDANPTQIDLYYDNKDMLNISNSTDYSFPADLLQFVATYNILDTNTNRPTYTADIDMYLKSDTAIVPVFNFSNFTNSGGFQLEPNLVPARETVSIVPTGNLNITYNKYDKSNFRKIYTAKTSGQGYNSTELMEVNDPVNRIIGYHGKIKLNSGFTIGGVLDYVPSISSKYSPLTELYFTVGVIYQYGNYSGSGIIRVTNNSEMHFSYYDRMDSQTIDKIDSIVLTGVSWEY